MNNFNEIVFSIFKPFDLSLFFFFLKNKIPIDLQRYINDYFPYWNNIDEPSNIEKKISKNFDPC